MFSKADTHIHTTASDGMMSPEDTVAYIARQTDLRVIAITDHDTAEGAFVARSYAQRNALPLDVIVGQEVSTGEGDVVGLFLNATLPSYDTAAEAIEAIRTQAGLAVAVHPFSRWATLNSMKGVGSKIFELPFDAVEVRNGFPTNLLSNWLSVWLNRLAGQCLPEFGGSDSHAPYTAGQAWTEFPGRNAADFRQAIECGRVRAGGPLWTTPNLIRVARLLIKQRGLRQPEPAFSD
jgi:predicted metal-dependent phosphoesterase TrpH